MGSPLCGGTLRPGKGASAAVVVDAVQKKKKTRKPKDPNAPPPGPLDNEVVQKIDEYLRENGGSSSLGKVSTVFEGVKKAQIEEFFIIVEPEVKGSCDPIVYTDADA